jgi:ribonuclease HI
MLAKYATACGACGASIRPGEEITSLPGGDRARWAHAQCPDGSVFLGDVPGQATFDLGGDPTAPPTAPPTASPSSPAARAPGRAARAGTAMATPAGALEVWTDGACSGNPGPGGWAWATRDGRQGYGSSPATTNQRMEVRAALEAMRALDGPLVVVSDSTYVVNCFRDEWWRGWLGRGWVNTAKKPVANRDLWEPLVELFRARGDVSFRWVKGHSGDAMNDVVDLLAVRAGKEQSHSG